MTTTSARLILAAALASPSALALAHSIDLAHTHSPQAPDGLTLLLLALAACLGSLTVAGLVVWRQRRKAQQDRISP